MEFLFLIIGILLGTVIAYLYFELKFKGKEKNVQTDYENTLNAEKERRYKAEAKIEVLSKTDLSSNEQMKNSVEAIAAKAFKGNNELFISMAKQVLEKYLVKAGSDIKQNRDNLSGIIEPLKQSLDKHENLVKYLQNQNNQTFGSLKTYLTELASQQQNL